MKEVRVLAATGMLGSGFLKSSLEEGLKRKPHFIGCDAGSTDPGSYYLGSGKSLFSREAYKRDIELMLVGAMNNNIPLIIGSAGTGGGDIHLRWTREIIEEIAEENCFHFKMAIIHAEQNKNYLKRKLNEGKIKPLEPAPEFNEDIIDKSARIVGMMGVEPFIKALRNDAQVILAGRSSDTSIFAALPIMQGFDPGITWHAAKILECGTAAVTHRPAPDSIFGSIREDHFVIEPLDPELKCTPQSVAAHNLYENADPYHLFEPSGMLETSGARYEAISDRKVRVSGSEFISANKYRVKLEGAEKVGYQTIIVGGVRDSIIIRQIDDWLKRLKERIRRRVKEVFDGDVTTENYTVNFRVYGKDGTMAKLEPIKETNSHELGLIIELTADTQDLADTIAQSVSHLAVHNPVPEWSGLITSLAFPYSPSHLQRGAVYRFNVNHLIEPDDPYEMFPIEFINTFK